MSASGNSRCWIIRRSRASPPPRDMGAKVEKLEDGFYSISGAAVDAQGKLYFVDKHQQRIYGWSREEGLSIERDNPTDPVNLAFDKSGNLLVLSSLGAEGTLYSFKPGSPATEMTVIAPHAGARASRRDRAAAGQLLEQWRVQGPARSRDLSLHHPERDVRPRHGGAQGQGICLARRQPVPARSRAPSSRARRTAPAGASPTIWTPTALSTAKPGSRVFVSNESEGAHL